MVRYVKHFVIMLLVALLVANEAGFLPTEEALNKTMQKAWGKITGLDVTAQMPTAAASEVPPALLQIVVPKVQEYGPINSQGAVDVRTFGAKGDGREDDTISIQAAIDSLPASGGRVWIPPGTYMVDAVRSICLNSGVTLLMTPQTILQALPNSAEWSAVLKIADVHDVSVVGGVVRGDRQSHLGKSGEWGMGVMITGAQRVNVQGTVASDCWGDGFYIGSELVNKLAEDIRLVDIQAFNNRRQGISLICGRNIEIIRPQLRHTNGTPPAAGIDIEPNRLSDILENIRIIEPYTEENQGSGISVNLWRLDGLKTPVDIIITAHQDNGSERGAMISGAEIVPGRLVFERPRWHGAKKNGIAVLVHDYRSFRIDLNDPVIVDANREGKKNVTTGAAIAVYDFKNNLNSWQSTVGNVWIRQPQLVDSGIAPKTAAAFYFWAIPGKKLREIAVVEPAYFGSIGLLPLSEEAKAVIQ